MSSFPSLTAQPSNSFLSILYAEKNKWHVGPRRHLLVWGEEWRRRSEGDRLINAPIERWVWRGWGLRCTCRIRDNVRHYFLEYAGRRRRYGPRTCRLALAVVKCVRRFSDRVAGSPWRQRWIRGQAAERRQEKCGGKSRFDRRTSRDRGRTD